MVRVSSRPGSSFVPRRTSRPHSCSTMRPAHEEDFLGCQQGASRRQVARRLRKIPFQGVLVRFRLPAPLTERIHVLFGKREGVVRPARVTVHAHEPGQQPGEDVGECLGTGTIGLAFVENGVDGKAAVFVLDGAPKGPRPAVRRKAVPARGRTVPNPPARDPGVPASLFRVRTAVARRSPDSMSGLAARMERVDVDMA